tara:strand:+ start:1210 stop:1704 length:495 start_codon:yes stop_codon:yes gene_type:complete
MEFNYNSSGNWSVDSVQERYRNLSLQLGGVAGFYPEPRKYTNQRGASWTYNVMESVVDGVQLGDCACIELSIEYIADSPMGSNTGYIRERMARALRHAELSDKQKARLAFIFINMLKTGKLYKEYREYIRLFKCIGINPYRPELCGLANSNKLYVRRAVEKLLA